MPVPFSIPERRIGSAIEQGSNDLKINVVPDTDTCRCPACGQASRSVHSRYRRHPADLPVSTSRTTLERYDAVIVAEGVGSMTRERVFTGENRPRWMDLTIAFFTIPRSSTDDRMWRWWAHMADIMETKPSDEPVVLPLRTLFHLP